MDEDELTPGQVAGGDETQILRSFTIQRAVAEDGETKVYRVSLSSETPVRDWPWAPPNVLVHSEAAVDLDGLAERGIPFYEMHQQWSTDSLIGRIVNLKLERKRLVGELRFSQVNERAAIVRGMVDEGTLTDMSISAEPLKREKVEESGEIKLIRITRWRPLEGSVVGIGADRSVGIGRQQLRDAGDRTRVPASEPTRTSIHRGRAMDDETILATPDDQLDEDQITRKRELEKQEADKDKIDRAKHSADENFAAEEEKRRVKSIRNLGRGYNIGQPTIERWIREGTSVHAVTDACMKIVEERGKTSPESPAYLGLNDNEVQDYSICRAILAARDGKWNDAGFEFECHKAVAEKYPMRQLEHGAFFVPLDVQRRRLPANPYAVGSFLASRHQGAGFDPSIIARDLQVAGEAGLTVGTQMVGFDPLLRNLSVLFRMGATRLTGLRDNIFIPRQNATATAEWLTGETDSPTESQLGFTQLPMTPKNVSAYTELSRQLLMQSSLDVEALVNADLAAVCALAADVAGLSGSGAAGQPMGLDNVTGVGSVSGASLGLAGVLESQTDVASANVRPMRGGYVTTSAVAALLIAEVAYANTASPLWGDPRGATGMPGSIWEGRMLGYPALSSEQVAAATMYFGDWFKMVVGEWGILEVQTNPYANFAAGIIGVRAIYSMDVGVRYPAAFSITTSIT